MKTVRKACADAKERIEYAQFLHEDGAPGMALRAIQEALANLEEAMTRLNGEVAFLQAELAAVTKESS